MISSFLRSLWLLTAILLFSQCFRPGEKTKFSSPFEDSVIREIHLMKDARRANGIVPHLQSRSELRRFHAALALASVGDSLTVPYLEIALKDRSSRVREMSAFALAQTFSMAAETALLKAVQDQTRARDRRFLLEHLGTCASDQGLAFLLRFRPGDDDTEIGLSKAFYRYVLRHGPKDNGVFERLSELLKEIDQIEAVRYLAMALTRSSTHIPGSLESILQTHYRNIDDPDTRIALIAAMGKLDQIQDSLFYKDFFPEQQEELLIYAWLNWAQKQVLWTRLFPNRMMALWNDNASWNTRYLLFKAQYKWGLGVKDESQLRHADPWNLLMNQSDLVFGTSALKQGSSMEAIRNYLDDRSKNPYEKALFVAEIGYRNELQTLMLGMFRDTSQPLILRNSLLECLLTGYREVRQVLLLEAMKGIEASFISIACLSMQNQGIPEELQSALANRLKNLKSQFANASGWETYLDLCRLEDVLTGNQTRVDPLPLKVRFTHRDLEKADTLYRVAMQTSRGTITFQLNTHIAPMSVLNVVQAIQTSYYNNKYIHRVVPGFVAQGGCHRGDGWGSPEWLQRSEFSLLPFNRGAIGIASVGKDTEGLQLFWMHAHAPHLEGRYSRIGEIESGEEILLKLQPGDKIIGMNIVE